VDGLMPLAKWMQCIDGYRALDNVDGVLKKGENKQDNKYIATIGLSVFSEKHCLTQNVFAGFHLIHR
jgi:hypothetical protein